MGQESKMWALVREESWKKNIKEAAIGTLTKNDTK